MSPLILKARRLPPILHQCRPLLHIVEIYTANHTPDPSVHISAPPPPRPPSPHELHQRDHRYTLIRVVVVAVVVFVLVVSASIVVAAILVVVDGVLVVVIKTL